MTLPKPAPSYYEYRKGEPEPDLVPALDSTTIIRNTSAIKESLRDRQLNDHHEEAA